MFDDLFSSSKGPGLIGLLLGIFVLAGFCGLGFAVFDGRLNGDFANKQQRQINQNVHTIAELEAHLKTYEATAEERRNLKKIVSKLVDVNSQVKLRQERKAGLEAEVAAAQAGIGDLATEWDAYKEQYRAQARTTIQGRKLDELTTADGNHYKDVEIREATPLELSIRTAEGPKRIKLAVLPKELRDELQYDEDQAMVVAREIESAEGSRDNLGRIGERVSVLERQIRFMQGTVDKHEQLAGTAAARKQSNEEAARDLELKAQEFMAAYQVDKQAGRPSRNDVRASAARRNADSLRNQNVQIDREVENARDEKGRLQGEIEQRKKEIEALEAERRAIIENRGRSSAPEGE